MAATADLLRALGLDAAVATRETRYYPDDILTSEGPDGFTTRGSSNTNEEEEQKARNDSSCLGPKWAMAGKDREK